MSIRDRETSASKRRNPRPARTAPRFNNSQFIQYELDASQQKELKAINATGDQLFDDILAEISDGYRFSCKYDSYGECYAVFMSTDDPDHANFGYILVGRGNSPLKAFKQVLYKHRVCLDKSWGGYAERRGTAIIDD